MNPTIETALPTRRHSYGEIGPDEAWAKRQEGVLVIDVRQVHEYDGDLGHVPGAQLHPLHEWPTVILEWDKTTPIVLVCRSGGRSGRAAEMLAANGFENVFNMVGGMLYWNERGLPIARGTE